MGGAFLALDVRSAQADQTVEQPRQSQSAIHDHVWVCALHHLARRIKQRPRIPGAECLMRGRTPFLEHRRNLAGHECLTIHRLDHEIVSLGVGDAPVPVAGDAFVDLEESRSQSTDPPRSEMTKSVG